MDLNPHLPAYIQVKNSIVDNVRKGVWKKNEKIPSEQKLMEMYNVGRGTIREAIKLVQEEGYVYIKKGVGTFVSQEEVSVSLEPFVSLTYFIKMRGLKIDSKILNEEIFIVDDETHQRTGLPTGSEALYLKRLRILEGKPLAIEEFTFSTQAIRDFEGFDFKNPISHYMFDVKKVSIKKMNMDFLILPVTRDIRDTLSLGKDVNMIKSSRTVFTGEGENLYYHLSFYCAEKLAHLNPEKFI